MNSSNKAYLQTHKIGFIGCGEMTKTTLQAWKNTNFISPKKIWASNRTEEKRTKVCERFLINPFDTNEEIIDHCDIIILSIKPQDFEALAKHIGKTASDFQTIISFAAGISLDQLKESFPQTKRIARVIPSTPNKINSGVIGYHLTEETIQTLIEDLFSPLGELVFCETEEDLTKLMIAASSGVGFALEIMQAWQEWLEENSENLPAKDIIAETFKATAQLSLQSEEGFLDLQSNVTSKKGVTAEGLKSFRKQELSRIFKVGFELANLKNEELGRLQNKK